WSRPTPGRCGWSRWRESSETPNKGDLMSSRANVRMLAGLRALLPGLALLGLGAPLWAWSPLTHQLVDSRAIDTLPKGLKAYYVKHRLELPSLSLEPAGPPTEEGPERRFAVDRVLPFPFTDLPTREEAFKARFPERAADVGRLPWLVAEAYPRLVEAFRSK